MSSDADEAKELAAIAKLPIDQRVASKNWKGRLAAYEQLKKDIEAGAEIDCKSNFLV